MGCLSGLKCAQVILAPADVERWRAVGLTASVAASTPGVIASTAAYRSGGPWFDEVLRYLDRNRRTLGEFLATHLPWVGYQAPQGTYLAWLDCRELARDLAGEPGGGSAGEQGGELGGDYSLDAFLRDEAGVAVVDGAECGEAGRGYVRLNFATPLPILKRALTRITHACDRRSLSSG